MKLALVKITLLALLLPLSTSLAQTPSLKTVSDSIKVSTSSVDSLFVKGWETCTIWFSGTDGWVKLGAPLADTTRWAEKDWIFLRESDRIIYGLSDPQLRRMEFKGTQEGTLFMLGTKKR